MEKELLDYKSKIVTLEAEAEGLTKQLMEAKSENLSLKNALASLKQELEVTVRDKENGHLFNLDLEKKLLECERELGDMERTKEAITKDLLMEAKGKQEMKLKLDDARLYLQKIKAEMETLHDWNKSLPTSYKETLEMTDIVKINFELEKLLNVKFEGDISRLIQSQIESDLNIKHLSSLPSFFFCARLLWRMIAKISKDS